MTEPILPGKTEREHAISCMQEETADLVVIGGGITGAGVALAAARRGLSVMLLEAEDFASGTSSRSTKLVHGGLRYLAMGDVRLVRESALERKIIRSIAPHLAEPGWMLLPARGAAERLKWRFAIAAYERLGAVARSERHRTWTGAELEREEPALAGRFPSAIAYREYRTDDARLVLANLRAAAGAGARVLNYARVHSLASDGPGHVALEARCGLSGEAFRVRARCAVNAAGPWVEAVRGLAEPGAAPWLHLTRGIHVALPAARLPLRHMVMLRGRDGRLMFAIPRGRVVYVGTTDTTHRPGPEHWPAIERADVDYVLEPLARHFAIAPVAPEEVVSAWAGLRPLVAQQGKSPSQISRRDEISIGPGRLVSVAGGKLTAYRPMAEAILARAGEVLGRALGPAPEPEPLPGGELTGSLESVAQGLRAASGLSGEIAERLAQLYGCEAPRVVGLGPAPLAPGAPLVEGEIDWAIQCEAALHLEDVLFRRTRAALYEPELDPCVEPAAARMAKLLSWTDAERAREVEQVRGRMRGDLGFRRGTSGSATSASPTSAFARE